ncbi:MAG: helicase-exonuclease AddAB subunit AddA [Planctomycetota bacterium]|nr:MAG: helicase-exonuclease AddAB subunit AddA [Planctomycetota bacterium]
MGGIRWTEPQKRAIDTTDVSVLVSAGAGSGKTAVLAERCAHLVTDARPPCGVDALLVVTFTDAAANEMRERIGRAVRARLERAPADARLHQQLALLDAAHISTLHSFCRRILERYFAHADLDPQTPILDPGDARLLRRESAKKVFDAWEARTDTEGESFLNLMAAYSAGGADPLIGRVLGVDSFLASILDPEGWLAAAEEAYRVPPVGGPGVAWRGRLIDELRRELDTQRATLSSYIEMLARQPSSVKDSVAALTEYGAAIEGWSRRLESASTDAQLDELFQKEIGGYAFPKAPRLTKKIKDLPPNEMQAFSMAADLVRNLRDALFRRRLQGAFGRYSLSDWAEGIARTSPHVRTLIALVRDVRTAYQAAKADLGVMDFTDLERRTLDLLRAEENGVARRLRAQFEHVLVDEFQDINPVQAEILRLVSRESGADGRGNLFTVGDVKQSIYRFRLAEPRLFLERKEAFEQGGRGSVSGAAIELSENFRSRPALLEAVNAVFERIMTTDMGGIAYDAGTRLKAGRAEADFERSAGRPPAELHILDDISRGGGDDSEDDSAEDTGLGGESAADWLRLERESYVIADRIEAFLREGYAYRDIVILLRSLQARSGLLMRTLAGRGIPAYSEVTGGFFEAVEVLDVLSLLAVLDNQQQDIPLAAVLRSPLIGAPVSDSELAAIRSTHEGRAAGVMFHEAVRAYSARGENAALRQRLVEVFAILEKWRGRIRRRALADVLWEIYSESGYLAYVSGQKDGVQRRANLIRLHEYARQFGTFRRQGLYHFLSFMDGMRDAEEELAPGVVSAGSEDVVRVMSIHRSKGLEFPVVIVGELGKRFNLSDARGMVLLDRRLGLGLEAVDETKRIRYSTLPHRMVSRAIENESRAEELRVLYVAMTRARERLVLVGTQTESKGDLARSRFAGHIGPLPLADRQSATCMLDWVAPAIFCLSERDAAFDDNAGGAAVAPRLFAARRYRLADMKEWRLAPTGHSSSKALLTRYAAYQPLARTETLAERGVIELMERRLNSRYPAQELTRVPAVAAASELKRRWETRQDAEEPAAAFRDQGTGGGVSFRFDLPALDGAPGELEATQRGTITHEFFQRVALARPCDTADLRRQLNAMLSEGLFSQRESEAIDLDSVAWFFATELGRRVRDARAVVLREWPFVIGIDPARYKPEARPLDEQDLMLVRGIVDCLFDSGEGWEILDYKTDRVSGVQLEDRAALYRGQLSIYAHAVEQTRGQAVVRTHLAFLAARQVVSFHP